MKTDTKELLSRIDELHRYYAHKRNLGNNTREAVQCLIDARQAIEALSGQNERLERKKDDYPDVLADTFNRFTAMVDEANKLKAENERLILMNKEISEAFTERYMTERGELVSTIDRAITGYKAYGHMTNGALADFIAERVWGILKAIGVEQALTPTELTGADNE